MTNKAEVEVFEKEFHSLFKQLETLQSQIHQKLTNYADGKTLKGNELVGWLGEIYGKILLNGTLVNDNEEHDLVTPNGWRVSVKTRKGFKVGWQRSSAIPKIQGEGCLTHLLFVHLSDDYSAERIWLFSWPELVAENRFKKHIVRGEQRSFIFPVDVNTDKPKVVFFKNADS